ncbi:MAG: glycoside hydrolase family 3 N-terminal domain-containing protein [Eubacteriales bacterium]|nr:glycoside hydrolase family 3 N-terminal domain-containing protein [Eubacteriales bacterium]
MKMRVRNKAAFTDEAAPLEEANLQVAYQAALEGIVLLENDGCLPVKPGRIALYGAGADMTIKGGTGSGEVNGRHAVSILEGLTKSGFTVTSRPWIDEYRCLYEQAEAEYRTELKKKMLHANPVNMLDIVSPFAMPYGQPVTDEEILAASADTCIYVVARQAGEGADRKLDNGDYSLSDVEKCSIALCAERFEKMIVVINVGASFDMSFLDEISGINAVVFLGQQGAMGGQAFADLLTGKVTPSGKLTDTWARRYEDYPNAMAYSFLNGELDEEFYEEGIYVGYRYFDSYGVEPKYPFGYGLSYTEFEIETKAVSVEKSVAEACVSVTNTGNCAGKETVQIYVSSPQDGIHKEYQRLAAFAKTRTLEPGEEEVLKLSFDMASLASYRMEDAATVLEQGTYLIRIGNSSRNTTAQAALVLDEEAVVSRHCHICENGTIEEMAPPVPAEEVESEETVRIPVCAKDIPCEIYDYQTPEVYQSPETDAFLDWMSLEEMAALTVGEGMSGERFFEAPGSAGSTTVKLLDIGIPNVSLADGPAGLRLQKRTAVMRNGKLKAVDPNIEMFKYFPETVKKLMFADPDKHPVVYQFTTAFPVGLALAQTWNPELIEKVGEAVGEEMKAYGVTYWLAPALNIHRNPLCGRNFEYYSEDPYLSGVFAAAMTRGVQKNRGCYVTIKHYCCNNQEDNRNQTNANVSERALREIYLKGFEIAVKEARPGAVMSSYNKVNGEYVNNSYDLLTKVLRNEWGFDGLVMTDWFATGKNRGSHVFAIEAGNDLIMPGSKGTVKEIIRAVDEGVIQEEDVKRCAANVLKGILSSRIYQGYRKLRKNNQ